MVRTGDRQTRCQPGGTNRRRAALLARLRRPERRSPARYCSTQEGHANSYGPSSATRPFLERLAVTIDVQAHDRAVDDETGRLECTAERS
jgi:hypothetical protein